MPGVLKSFRTTHYRSPAKVGLNMCWFKNVEKVSISEF